MATATIVPVLPPPPGTISNFLNPYSHTVELITCNVVLLVVGVLVVTLRIISRTVLTKWRLGWDDYTMVISLIGTVIFTGFLIQTTKFGLGRHIWDVPQSWWDDYLHWVMVAFATCPATYLFVKLSILFFYLRVFPRTRRNTYTIYAMMAYCTTYYIFAVAAVAALCNAKNKDWDIHTTMNCFGYGPVLFAIGVLDLVSDLLVLIFPLPMVWRLKVSWHQRVYLLSIFGAGLVATFACILRIIFAAKAQGSTDATMAQYRAVTLFCIEHWFAVIAACMPTLGPFFQWLRPGKWRSISLNEKGAAASGVTHDPESGRRIRPESSQDEILVNTTITMHSSANRNHESWYAGEVLSKKETRFEVREVSLDGSDTGRSETRGHRGGVELREL